MKTKIYIAEDYAPNAALMQELLDGHPQYEVTIFNDGLDLYQRVQLDPPGLLVLDIILPSLTGLAIARLLKFQLDFRKIPIMVVSSVTDDDIGEQAAQYGADAFLRKPFDSDVFLKEISRLLS